MQHYEIEGSCHTKPSSIKTSFLWTIEEFSTITDSSINSTVFPFKDHSSKWYLSVYPKGNVNIGSVAIYIYLDSCDDLKLTAHFSISLVDKFGEKQHTKVVASSRELRVKDNWGFHTLITHKELEEDKKNLLVNDTLTIICEIEILQEPINIYRKDLTWIQPKPIKQNIGYSKLFQSDKYSDAIINITSPDERTTIKIHKVILAARSSFFASLFSSGATEYDIDVISIPVTLIALEFIYTGSTNLPGVEEHAEELLKVACLYDLPALLAACSENLLQNVKAENAANLLRMAIKNKAEDLRRGVLNFIKAHPDKVLQHESWANLEVTDPHLANKTYHDIFQPM